MPRNLLGSLVLVLISLVSLSSLAQAPPSADAYVTSSQGSTNFGSSPLLPVQSGTTSYVSFNLSALPSHARIAKATLRLYVNAVADSGSFDVYQVDSGWSERGLTFSNAPTLGNSATGGRSLLVNATSPNQFILIDITGLVQGWLDGSIPNYGVALALTSVGGSFSFDSKESTGTGHQPELEVVLGTSSGTGLTGAGVPLPGAAASKADVSTSAPHVDSASALLGFAASPGPTTNPATNFADITTDQVVQVQQNGTGMGLTASSPSNVAILGTLNYIAKPGVVAGVEGTSAVNNGYGMFGYSAAASGGIGIHGRSDSPNGIGLQGWAIGTGGIAINATSSATSGSPIGLVARTSAPNATGALIWNTAGAITGSLITAQTGTSGVIQFTVSGSGNVNAAGSLTGTRLISTVATGTAPFQVASTTLVPNLNASLLGGNPASAFALVSGSSGYVQNGTAPQTGASYNIDGSGTVGGTLTGATVNSTGNYQIGSSVILGVGAAADHNLFVGSAAGANNVPSSGQANAFVGFNAGLQNTTGSDNTFVGTNAGQPVTTGSNNTFLGSGSGSSAGAAASNDIYVSNQGLAADSGVIRIGDPANQTSAYMAGVNGSATTAGVPVFVDSTGKLGTGGGSVNFSQVVGTVSSPQFTGTYSNAVNLSNTSNSFSGTFAGNGAGLTGVSSGLSWPIVTKNVDYSIQTSDFSTPTHYGNFIVLTGLVKRTFTLPNPPPPNGSCVGIGNVAQTTGANTYLSVNPNGLNVDGGATAPTHPRRASYLYCSDGTGYWRFGQNQNGVSEIGPWLYTADNGTANVLTTSFLSGLDFGLIHGTMMYLWPANANTSTTPTLNVNQLGAVRIVKFGNQALAPGDLTHTALAHLIFDGNLWQLLNPQTNQGTVTAVTATAPLVSSGGVTPNLSCPACVTNPTLSGTTGSIGGSALTAGGCTTGTAAVTGATVGHPVAVSASDGTLPNGFIILSAAVTSSNTVTVQLCATASVTPTANTYSVSTQ